MKNFHLSQLFVYTSGNFKPKTVHNLLAVNVIVAYRSEHPDKETVERVQEELRQNISARQLVKWRDTYCKQAHSSKERGCFA